jgi:hypothetical protein
MCQFCKSSGPNIDACSIGKVERSRHVETLGNDHRLSNPEDAAGPDHRRPCVEARVVLEMSRPGTPSRISALRIVSGSS